MTPWSTKAYVKCMPTLFFSPACPPPPPPPPPPPSDPLKRRCCSSDNSSWPAEKTSKCQVLWNSSGWSLLLKTDASVSACSHAHLGKKLRDGRSWCQKYFSHSFRTDSRLPGVCTDTVFVWKQITFILIQWQDWNFYVLNKHFKIVAFNVRPNPSSC